MDSWGRTKGGLASFKRSKQGTVGRLVGTGEVVGGAGTPYREGGDEWTTGRQITERTND